MQHKWIELFDLLLRFGEFIVSTLAHMGYFLH